ncbi:uncharacterized protein ACHE_31174S [Aspergillus chevalieri]|uniref:Uncharacterized protein n=1 Tax=Aspergillus chevalieri TaxID=182096 RepID=A0A7R7VMG7_ASPCH|nr:uncharacterized protein ACHE_31174S [Aspergillus chevalieri]BCR87187.1 hypothetical protein ACHE_31174S [Aspergillus chevalieri]
MPPIHNIMPIPGRIHIPILIPIPYWNNMPLPPPRPSAMALQISRTMLNPTPRPAVRYGIPPRPEIVPLIRLARCPGECRGVHVSRLLLSRSGCVGVGAGRVYIVPPCPSTIPFPRRTLFDWCREFDLSLLAVPTLVLVLGAADPSNENIRPSVPEDIEEAPAVRPV